MTWKDDLPCRTTIHGRNGACPSMITNSLHTLFEGSGLAAQIGQDFSGEMQ
jgi:hypothetical protein